MRPRVAAPTIPQSDEKRVGSLSRLLWSTCLPTSGKKRNENEYSREGAERSHERNVEIRIRPTTDGVAPTDG